MDKCVILGFFVLFAGGRVCFGALISGAVTLREPAAGTAEQRGVSWCKKCYFGVFVEKVFRGQVIKCAGKPWESGNRDSLPVWMPIAARME